MGSWIAQGQYARLLREETIVEGLLSAQDGDKTVSTSSSAMEWISQRVETRLEEASRSVTSSSFVVECFQLELVGIAALNLFLQSN